MYRTLLRTFVFITIIFVTNAQAASTNEAFYLASTSVEGQTPPVSAVRLTITGTEDVDGETYTWWEVAAQPRKGQVFGLRICSQRAPMASPEGVGRIHRYIYCDTDEIALDYRDEATGNALLPTTQFREHFLPQSSRDARYENGFASSGRFLGHVLTRVKYLDDINRADFSNTKQLVLRSDFIVAVSAEIRQPEGSQRTDNKGLKPWVRADYEKMIEAGANFFHPSGVHIDWIKYEPVFYMDAPTFTDDFYRSNYFPSQMYIDEPMVRLGWSGGIPGNAMGPEQVAEALRQRVAAFYTTRNRIIKTGNDDLGRFDPVKANAISWDTDYWSTWYQLSAGAPAVVHEARYEKHNYGWHPKELYGEEGLEGVGFNEQINCINGFLRGAARAFDADWGTSGYPEGTPEFRIPAFKRAYDMGNRYLWFWTHDPAMSFDVQHEIIKAVCDHAKTNPRDSKKAINAAKVGIAFPPGYVFGWKGTWGMDREQLSRDGASFGDISAAGLWEGILCSLNGVEFDFLVDEPHIRDLGYNQLVIVKTDGNVERIPSRKDDRAAQAITLRLDDDKNNPNIAARMTGSVDYTVSRATDIVIDGQLNDWQGSQWITLNTTDHGWPDKVDVGTITLVNDTSNNQWNERFKALMGMRFAQVNDELSEVYQLDDFNGLGIVVTEVMPGSPADKAGVLVGDVVVGIGHMSAIKYQFRIWEFFSQWVDKNDGKALDFHIQRSGKYDYAYEGDLGATVAMKIDDAYLYLAARVTDDVHSQRHFDWDYWKGDSLQIGFDPTLERREYGYGEENQEFGFILKGDDSIVWRYRGRRGQPLGNNTEVTAKIIHNEGVTVYEIAIPIAQLEPISPDLWPMCGFNVVINDSDGLKTRKSRLELRRPAMTRGKRPKEFAQMQFEPSDDTNKVSAALMWRKRTSVEGDGFRLVLAAASPEASEATIRATLQSLDSPNTQPVVSEMTLPLSAEPREHNLHVDTASLQGRYHLAVEVRNNNNKVVASDSLPVYIYPDSPGEKWPATDDESEATVK